MKCYMSHTIVVIVVSISSTRNRIIRTIYNARTFNRNLLTYSNPLSSAVSPSSAVNGSLSSSEMISILRRSASNPMLHINGMDGFCIFICFSRRINMRCIFVFRININTERRRIVDTNSSTCGTSNCNQHDRHESNRDKFFHKSTSSDFSFDHFHCAISFLVVYYS